MKGLRIIRRSTGVIVTSSEDNFKVISDVVTKPLLEDLKQYTSKWDNRLKRKVKLLAATWWYESPANKFLSFHRAFDHKLNGIDNVDTYVTDMEPVKGASAALKLKDTFAYREGQEKFVDFLATHPSHTRILPATMGAGKTASALAAIAKMNKKALVIIPPQLTNEWLGSIDKFINISPESYTYLSGDAAFYDLYDTVRNGGEVPWDITVVSINSLQRFISSFKEVQEDFSLPDFFDKSGWGVRVVDEAHKYQHFHSLCSSLMNFEVNIFLTATLMKEYDFDSMMENAVYPKKDRCAVPVPSNHIELISYAYDWDCWVPECIGPMGYQHSKYEKFILSNKLNSTSYLGMIADMVNRDFVAKFQPNDKAVVFFGLVDMVELFFDVATVRFPKLKIIKYSAGDSKDILKHADLIITTVKKAGTGTDIPQLVYVLQTIPISAKGENYQNAGRLRNLFSRATTFAYLWTKKVSKHWDYHIKRQNEFTPLINSRSKINYPNVLKGKSPNKKK